jgi:thymidine kinase
MKLVATGSTVEVGETDKYEARCRAHFTPTR